MWDESLTSHHIRSTAAKVSGWLFAERHELKVKLRLSWRLEHGQVTSRPAEGTISDLIFDNHGP